MNFSLHFGVWDAVLLAAVTVQATAIAYVHSPRWKVLLLSFPLPFTLASLALARPVGATHAAGVTLMLLYTHGVRLLHYWARAPIVGAIAISAAAYCLAAAALTRVIPATDTVFWVAVAVAFATAAAMLLWTARRDEPGHRTPLALWVKLPIIAAVILLLICAKQLLGGFMALFPMVGVVTAYEARHSLWTVCRQIPAVTLALMPMMAAVRLTQEALGLGVALAIGWGVFLAVLTPLSWRMWFAAPRTQRERGRSPR